MKLQVALVGAARNYYYVHLSLHDCNSLDSICAALQSRFPETPARDQVRWAISSLPNLRQGRRTMVDYARQALDIHQALSPGQDPGEKCREYCSVIQDTVVDRFIENIQDESIRGMLCAFKTIKNGEASLEKVVETAIKMSHEDIMDLYNFSNSQG